jgi:hypothetical protein
MLRTAGHGLRKRVVAAREIGDVQRPSGSAFSDAPSALELGCKCYVHVTFVRGAMPSQSRHLTCSRPAGISSLLDSVRTSSGLKIPSHGHTSEMGERYSCANIVALGVLHEAAGGGSGAIDGAAAALFAAAIAAWTRRIYSRRPPLCSRKRVRRRELAPPSSHPLFQALRCVGRFVMLYLRCSIAW